MRKNLFILIGVVGLVLSGCAKKMTDATTYYKYETQCLGAELDGSQTLLAWGEGRNRADAVEQAKKNAVYDVIFKGINAGSEACDRRPILNTPNARDRFNEYFNIFFTDGGEYRKYVSTVDEKRFSRNRENYQYGRKMSVTVRVLRSELKIRLQDDGILKKY